MNIIKQCEFCETSLVFEKDGKTYEFTKHDDDFCKEMMRNTIRVMRDAMKSNAELMAQKCIEFGMEIERRRDESGHDRMMRQAQEVLNLQLARQQAEGGEG